nr:cytochrome B561 and DOMON domain-containing protein At3g61750-like [Ipomoea batatas]GMD28894.1 cytochrome B561 and DOMON domain-containing protein At3g61750-like [Ipomoea batatas]
MGANFSFPEWQSAMSSLVALFLVMLIGFGIGNVVADEDEEFCRSNITSILPPPYGTMKNMICQNVWNTFTIRYSQTKDNVITIVLSAIYTTGWVGMGFSSDGMMLNSSCMVGWIPPGGKGQIRQYHVEGLMPSEIKHNKGELPLTKTPPLAVLHNGTIYLAFQLKYPSPLGLQPIILAYSTDYPHQDLRLTHHDDKTSIIFDFSSSSKSAAMESIKTVKMIHGVVGILGWGFFLPCGAMVARYLKHHNPLWFYLHICCQVTGFLLGFVTVIVGLQLYNQLDSDIPTHKGIGILLLVLSILQMFALFLRPHRDSQYRKYWNWYHSWVGRTALFYGALNIVLGMYYAESGGAWKTTYGILVGFIMLTCIVLEVFVEQKKLNDLPPPPPTS